MELLQVLGWPQQAALNLSLHQGEVKPRVEEPWLLSRWEPGSPPSPGSTRTTTPRACLLTQASHLVQG